MTRFPSRLSFRLALVAIIVLLAAGVVAAVSSLVQQIINTDPGLKSVYDAGKGIPLNLSQTIDGYTVNLEWAYADGNRLTIAYTIAGLPGVEYTNLESDSTSLTTADGKTEFSMEYGEGNYLQTSSIDPTQIPTGNISGNQLIFDVSKADVTQSVLNLRFEVSVSGVTVAKRTEIPSLEPWSALHEGPSQPFVFNFSLPLNGTLRVLNAPQIVTDQGITITLDKVTVAPSQTTVTVCFTVPDTTRQWTSIPRLTTNRQEVPGGGMVQTMKAGETQHCDNFSYNADMYEYHGEWQFEITELVGFGSRGDDQQRIKGLWVFRFTVP